MAAVPDDEIPRPLASMCKRGQRIHVCSPIADEGLSVLGTKTLLFSSKPLVAIHDTGGLLGDAETLKLAGGDLEAPERFVASWVHKGTMLVGCAVFERGLVARGAEARF